MRSVAIIGAGIAGLTAAYRLRQEGLTVNVFEAADRPGGVIRTERADGYLVEHGPNSVQVKTPLLDALIAELGLMDERVTANAAARRRYVVRGGRPVALPASPPAFLTTGLFSLGAKVRLLREPFIRPADPEAEETVAAFVRRRLGQELLDYAINPFVAGVFAGDPARLSLRHAFPKLHALEQEHGSLIRGQIARMRAREGGGSPAPTYPLISFRDGLQRLPEALAARLGPRLHLRAPVTSVQRAGSGWQVTYRTDAGPQTHPCDAVLLAAPLHRLASVALPEAVPAPLREVAYPPVSIVALGYPRAAVAHPLDGFGMLVPAVEPDLHLLGTLFSSTLFPGRAPAGHVLLTSFVGGARDPAAARADTATVTARVTADLVQLLGVRGAPVFARHIHWPHAIPQYEVGYGRVKAALDALEVRHPGLFFAGNYRQGIAVSDTVASGHETAGRLLQALSS